jgi:NADH:ubiquinone oxidoreductase subunit 3 (subunit A)
VFASYFLALRRGDAEKVSVYESGFDPVGDSRQKFAVRFFLVAIVFIIFDLEVSFLFPWSVALSYISSTGYVSMMAFIVILALGLVYEFLKGGLEWE